MCSGLKFELVTHTFLKGTYVLLPKAGFRTGPGEEAIQLFFKKSISCVSSILICDERLAESLSRNNAERWVVRGGSLLGVPCGPTRPAAIPFGVDRVEYSL